MNVQGMGLTRNELCILSDYVRYADDFNTLTIENLYLFIHQSALFKNCIICEMDNIVYIQRVKL